MHKPIESCLNMDEEPPPFTDFLLRTVFRQDTNFTNSHAAGGRRRLVSCNLLANAAGLGFPLRP